MPSGYRAHILLDAPWHPDTAALADLIAGRFAEPGTDAEVCRAAEWLRPGVPAFVLVGEGSCIDAAGAAAAASGRRPVAHGIGRAGHPARPSRQTPEDA